MGSINKLPVNHFQQNYMFCSKIWNLIPCGLVSSAAVYISTKRIGGLKNHFFDVAAFYLRDTVICTAVNVSNGASLLCFGRNSTVNPLDNAQAYIYKKTRQTNH